MQNYFSDIEFDEKKHIYWCRGKRLKSTTELISTLEKQVDWKEKASGVAIREGTSTDLILKRWNDKKKQAGEKGTFIHKYIERRLRLNTELDTLHSEMIAWDVFWKKAREHMQPQRIEWRIGDYNLGVGGTIDCLFYSSKTEKYHPFDWKSNEKFTQESQWQNLNPPFEDLEDCHLTKYSLQLAIYKIILQCNTDLALGESYIIWLNSQYHGEFYTKIKALNLVERARDWLTCLNYVK